MKITQASDQLLELVSLGEDNQAIQIFSQFSAEEKKAVMMAAPLNRKLDVLNLETTAEGVRTLIKNMRSLEIGAVVLPEVGTAMGDAIASHMDFSAVLKTIKTLVKSNGADTDGIVDLLTLIRENDDVEHDTYRTVLEEMPAELLAYIYVVFYDHETERLGYADQLFSDLENHTPKKFREVMVIVSSEASEEGLFIEIQKLLEEII